MRSIIRVTFLALLATAVTLLVPGCMDENPVDGGGGDNPLSCETHNWAYVRVENRSTDTRYDVYWDGACQFQGLAPGSISEYFPVSASQPHTLEFKMNGGQESMCTHNYPNLGQCTNYTYWCNGEACEINHTAHVGLANRSASTAYRVYWGGEYLTMLQPGETYGPFYPVAAQYSLTFVRASDGRTMCSGTHNLEQCHTYGWYCDN